MKKAFFFFLLFCLGAGSLSSRAEDYLDSASSDLFYEKAPEKSADKKPKKEKAFGLNAGLQQISGFIKSADHISQLFVSGSYSFSFLKEQKARVALSQKINRHFFLNPNSKDQGLWIQDSILSAETSFKPLGVKIGLSSTLPLSYDSQIKSIFTVSSAYLSYSWLLDSLLSFKPKAVKNIELFIKPVGRYYFSRWTTSQTEKQSLGGLPRPELLFGLQSLGLSLSLTDYFSFSGSWGRWVIFPYKTKYKNLISPDYKGKRYQRHYYMFSLTAGFKINPQWRASLAYAHIDRLDKKGRTDINFFDDKISSWSMAISYSLAFNKLSLPTP